MRKRWRLLGAILIGGIAAGIFIPLPWPAPTGRINRESFEKIKLGMSMEEVKELLGGPPGIYRAAVRDVAYPNMEITIPPDSVQKVWEGNWGLIWLAFDPNGRVTAMRYYDVQSRPVSAFDLLRGSA